MRHPTYAVALAGVLLAACSTEADRSTTLVAPPPQFAGQQDLVGTPDLVVDSKKLATSWVIYDEFLPAEFCSVQEGGVEPGDHRTLRFTVTTPNIGDADVFVGDPNERVNDGLFELATCHAHYHFRNYATYELFPINSKGKLGSAILAAKRGFCMIDVTPAHQDGDNGSWVYRSCGAVGIPGNQGISAGWADTYVKWLGGQYFIIDDLAPADYLIRVTVNPPFTQVAGDVCPAKDPRGLCHMFAESDYSNNIGEARITIPTHTGKTGYGPGGGGTPPGKEASDDENRPTK